MAKRLCRFCNNSVKVQGGYACLGGNKETIATYERHARGLKKYHSLIFLRGEK